MGAEALTKVLAVDDEETVLRSYRTGFGRSLEVLTATCSTDALTIAIAERPQLIIVDLRLGREWGINLVRALRLRLPDSRIVVVSGYVSVATAIGAVRAGATYVFTKPVTPQSILRELDAEPQNVNEPESPEAFEDDSFLSLERVEWEHILRALNEAQGNVSRAARMLGIRRTSLQRKLKKSPPSA
jgi:two-component system response regulator RegA